jgi:hypothetical protein
VNSSPAAPFGADRPTGEEYLTLELEPELHLGLRIACAPVAAPNPAFLVRKRFGSTVPSGKYCDCYHGPF